MKKHRKQVETLNRKMIENKRVKINCQRKIQSPRYHSKYSLGPILQFFQSQQFP